MFSYLDWRKAFLKNNLALIDLIYLDFIFQGINKKFVVLIIVFANYIL